MLCCGGINGTQLASVCLPPLSGTLVSAHCSTSALQKAWALVALFSSSFFLFFPLPLFAALWPRSSGPCLHTLTLLRLASVDDDEDDRGRWTCQSNEAAAAEACSATFLLLSVNLPASLLLRFFVRLLPPVPVPFPSGPDPSLPEFECECTNTHRKSEAHVTADSAAAALANLSTVVCVCPAIHIVSHAYQFLAFIHSMTEWMCVYVSPRCLYLPV